MLAQRPQAARLRDRAAVFRDLLLCGVGVKFVLLRLVRIEAVQQRIHLAGLEAGEGNVEVGGVKLRHERGQLFLVPIALNLVEGDVERLFPPQVQIDHYAVDFRLAHVHKHFEPLVPADHVPRPAVPDHRLHIAKLHNGALELFILPVARLQVFARVVRRRIQPRGGNFLYVHENLISELERGGWCRTSDSRRDWRAVCC